MPPTILPFNWRKHGGEVIEFQRETYETNFPGFRATERFLQEYAGDIRRSMNNAGEGLFVLEDGGRTCGFLWVSIIQTMVDPRIGYIRNIYVSPWLRGQGYGRVLLEFAERWCAAQGVRRVSLDASCCNRRAMEFYRKAGYEEVRVRMEKRLDSALEGLQERRTSRARGGVAQ